jgi:hypothetical protein
MPTSRTVVQVGIEFMPGRRVITDDPDGRATRLQLSAMYSF